MNVSQLTDCLTKLNTAFSCHVLIVTTTVNILKYRLCIVYGVHVYHALNGRTNTITKVIGRIHFRHSIKIHQRIYID